MDVQNGIRRHTVGYDECHCDIPHRETHVQLKIRSDANLNKNRFDENYMFLYFSYYRPHIIKAPP